MKQSIVAIQFQHRFDRSEWGGKEYHYKTFMEDLKEDDLVVVETQLGHTVAKVSRYLNQSNQAFNYIIQKVDLTEHENYLEKEMKLSFIQAEIEDRAEEIRKRKEIEILAKEDEKLKKLIADMDELLS